MSDVTITDEVYDEIKSKLHELKKKFDSNIKITRDDYFGDIITIKKGCFSSNSSLLALRCNCCKNVINFAQDFNEKFDFLLEHKPPLDFIKLDNPNLNNRRFKVEIKPDFFKSCGFMTSSNNQQGGFLGNQDNTYNTPNPCNITEAYPLIVKKFYKILGISCPTIVVMNDPVISMFNQDDDKAYDEYTSHNGGLRIMRKTRRKSKSKKYKKMRKNKRSKKHHRRTTRRTRRK
jgi:hypothetical protein